MSDGSTTAGVVVEFGPPCLTPTGLRLRYNKVPPTPKQAAFLALTCKEALYGGTVAGGKSVALMQAAMQFIDVPNYHAILFRRTLKQHKAADGLIALSKWMLADAKAAGLCDYNANDYTWTFRTNGEPSTLQFGYMQNPGDELNHQGPQYQFVGWDEITQFPDEAQYEYLFSRQRRPKLTRSEMIALWGCTDDGLTIADIPLRTRATGNPGGPGMFWVKPRFVDPETATAPFLTSTFYDNPAIDAEEYKKSLAHLSEIQRRRLELGDWDVVEVPGALWRFEDIHRVEEVPPLDVIAVAVDGAVSEGTGDEAGIVVGGITADGVVVVLEDQSIRAHPDEWARKAVLAYHDYGATRLVIEKNQGGEMNRSVLYGAAEILKLPHPNVVLVHAASNTPKELRAQPVSQAYRASHGGEVLTHKVMHGPLVRDSELEAQMASWVPGDKLSVKHGSPDRVDALVWLVQHLLFKQGSGGPIRTTTRTRDRMSSWR